MDVGRCVMYIHIYDYVYVTYTRPMTHLSTSSHRTHQHIPKIITQIITISTHTIHHNQHIHNSSQSPHTKDHNTNHHNHHIPKLKKKSSQTPHTKAHSTNHHNQHTPRLIHKFITGPPHAQFITTTHIPKLIKNPAPPLHFQQHLRTASNLTHNKAKILTTDHNKDKAKSITARQQAKILTTDHTTTNTQKSITAKQQTKSRTAEQASKKPNSPATSRITNKFELRHCPLK